MGLIVIHCIPSRVTTLPSKGGFSKERGARERRFQNWVWSPFFLVSWRKLYFWEHIKFLSNDFSSRAQNLALSARKQHSGLSRDFEHSQHTWLAWRMSWAHIGIRNIIWEPKHIFYFWCELEGVSDANDARKTSQRNSLFRGIGGSDPDIEILFSPHLVHCINTYFGWRFKILGSWLLDLLSKSSHNVLKFII